MAREIDPGPFAVAHAEGQLVVDVRESFEYTEGHVPGAVWIPMAQLPQRVNELPTSGPVYVICASGNRSLWAADLLSAAGVEAYSVRGGTSAWQSAGRPIVRGANAA